VVAKITLHFDHHVLYFGEIYLLFAIIVVLTETRVSIRYWFRLV